MINKRSINTQTEDVTGDYIVQHPALKHNWLIHPGKINMRKLHHQKYALYLSQLNRRERRIQYFLRFFRRKLSDATSVNQPPSFSPNYQQGKDPQHSHEKNRV